MDVYVVDSNFFIQAHRVYYPIDVASSFWNKIRQLALDGKIISVDKVKNEIFKHEDALKQWCDANLPANFFHDTQSTTSYYAQLVTWALSKSSHYMPNAIAEFLDADEADAWLIAFGLQSIDDRILVTYEVSQPGRKNKIKIPDVCADYNVKYVNTIEMLRQLGETF